LLALGAAYAVLGGVVLVVALVRTPCASGGERSAPLAGLAELRQLWADPVMRGLVYFVFVGHSAHSDGPGRRG
jgi:hypothetical protein